MEPFRYHVYVCDQKKPDGAPCCSAQGSAATIEVLRREIAKNGLLDVVHVTVSGSLGLCGRGPNMVVYPEGVWYSAVRPEDVVEIVREHFVAGQPVQRLRSGIAEVLKEEITGNRNKMVAAMQARDAAGVLPDEIMVPGRGYQESRILLTAVELDMFSQTSEPATSAEVAKALSTNPHGTTVVLDALAAMGLLKKNDGRYQNTPIAARFLAEGGKNDSRLALRHQVALWDSWSDLTERLRSNGPVAPHRPRPRDTEAFIGAMHQIAGMTAPLVVRAVDASGVRRMLDVGGGSGAYSIAFAHEHPKLQATILDMAPVLPIAAHHIEEAKLTGRVTTTEGDLRSDDLGSGYDLALLSAICHMLGPDENQDLLKRVFAALAPGGRVVIRDHIMAADKTTPRTGAIFAINMLVNTPKGSSYSENEYAAWLSAAGFVRSRRIPLQAPNDLMIAERPA